jgi:hypothetical protein
MLAAQQSVAFGLRFFTELLENPVPISIELRSTGCSIT